ncbi:major facilitator superfamily transporter [Penicillium atrosanguineum]|uniref:Major facilitator superfamily transporter n=1 Tax=Penicillium atrosanguineum TaxID=1132637 RepID=A0A9W9GG34_9EURO|nr:major facilitator superfamily transporter [Penicillium atrosanguineum]KAJ5119249.1 major facilitator superfamily transporter [Penicillium atrosanguineum]KAJ5299012.1 major facilitator superfamily transporter [Penicillium atrosanguineum]
MHRQLTALKTWTRWMKLGITLNICANAFLNNACAAGLVPTLDPVAAELGVTITTASYLMSYNVLAQGLSNLIWVPTTLCYGKRWVVLISMALLLPCLVWAAVATSFESLLGARVLGGFASGASEAFAPMIIGDIWYEHDLTTALGFFALCTFAGATLGQTALGFVTEGLGWRWAYWIILIACSITMLSMLFWLPETTFQRGLNVGITAGDVQRNEEMHEKQNITSPVTATPSADTEPHAQADRAEPLVSMHSNIWFVHHPEIDYSASWISCFVGPFYFVLLPTVLWSSLAYAVTSAAFTSVGVCIVQLLGAPPYNFSPGDQGLFSLSSFIGIVLGGTLGSKSVDIVNARINRRRSDQGKIHKPEERLIMLALPFFTATVGLVLYGVAVERRLPWIGPAFGYGIHSFGFVVLAGITFSYAIDSYLVKSGEVMVFNNTLRALISFGVSHIVPTWLNNAGPAIVYSVLGSIIWGFLLLGIPVIIFGPKIRNITNRFV